MYLLDTNVISELRRARPHGAVVAWLQDVPDADLHVSAVTVGEIQSGIEKTRDRDPKRAGEIERWLEDVAQSFNILSVDGRTFRAYAKLRHGRSASIAEDAMIAAAAVVHGLTVVTRNVRDFESLGVPTIDPFKTRNGTKG